MSGKYTAVVSGATGGNLEVLGASTKNNSDLDRGLQVLDVVSSVAELAWIRQSIISVRLEMMSAQRFQVRFNLLLDHIRENLALLSSYCSFMSVAVSCIASSPWADIFRRAFKSYVFPLLNILDVWGKLKQPLKKLIRA